MDLFRDNCATVRRGNLQSGEASDPRMNLTLKDMPSYKGEIVSLIGESRDHYPDGTFRPRWMAGGKPKSEE